MPSNQYFLRCIVIAAITASVISCKGYAGKPIDSYRGDGKCTTITAGDSVTANVLTRGYRIDFGPFHLGRTSETKYSIDKLPSTRRGALNFQIDVSGNGLKSGKDLKNKLHGQLTMQLKTRDGKVVFNCSGPIQKWSVTECCGDPPLLQVFWSELDSNTSLSGDYLRKNAGYDLYLKYEPAQGDIPIVGKVQARAGGYF